MKRTILMTAAALCAIACGSTFNAPFSSSPIPSSFALGDKSSPGVHAQAEPPPAGVPGVPPAGGRNRGTQVWLVPAPAGDMMELSRHPELWPEAQKRVDVFSFYSIEAYDHPGFVCGTPCGPNTHQALLAAVPGGMFKWMGDRYLLAMEAGSVKPFACTEETIASHADAAIRSLDNVVAAGAHISYISLDEPFASGVNKEIFGGQACGLTPGEVARLQRIYNDRIHAKHPDVVIGFIEPYPAFSADEIISFLLELEHAGVSVPFFHLDWYLPGTVREDGNWRTDVSRIRDFCRARGIPFGVILWGEDGRADEPFSLVSMTVARASLQAVGITEHTVLQSWAEDPPGDVNSLKHKPDTVPESKPGTHTWLVNWTLKFLGIAPS